MERILVSACLLGQPVRYDGSAKRRDDDRITRWRAEGRLVSFCPEVGGGLPVPRPAAEIEGGHGGADVLAGRARVLTADGTDVTGCFIRGAQGALAVAQRHGVRLAILKEGSPSCGSGRIYDGSFRGRTLAERGVTTALLEQHDIQVFNEDQLAAAARLIDRLERAAPADAAVEVTGQLPGGELLR